MEKEYPDPAERYEHLHREEREFELDYDRWLLDVADLIEEEDSNE